MLPSKIVMATSKGGTGKSTLARSIALHLLEVGYKPAIIDADPQESIFRKHKANEEYEDERKILKKLEVKAEPEEAVVDVIAELEAKGYSPIIIDTAGYSNRTTALALTYCDLALIPLKAEEDDMMQALKTLALIKKINGTPTRINNPIKTEFLLTMTVRSAIVTKSIIEDLKKVGIVPLTNEMVSRVTYQEAASKGLSPVITEPEGAAARDISNIVDELMEK